MPALTWAAAMYESTLANGLALCTDHLGEHIWRLDHCIQVYEAPRAGRYRPCLNHDGRHMDVGGQCVHWGARFSIRPGRCSVCGAPIINRLDLQTGRTVMLGEGDEEQHEHPRQPEPPQEVEPARLAEAIVMAARAMRGDRERKPEPTPSPVVEPVSNPRHAADFPAVDVWAESDGAI